MTCQEKNYLKACTNRLLKNENNRNRQSMPTEPSIIKIVKSINYVSLKFSIKQRIEWNINSLIKQTYLLTGISTSNESVGYMRFLGIIADNA